MAFGKKCKACDQIYISDGYVCTKCGHDNSPPPKKDDKKQK